VNNIYYMDYSLPTDSTQELCVFVAAGNKKDARRAFHDLLGGEIVVHKTGVCSSVLNRPILARMILNSAVEHTNDKLMMALLSCARPHQRPEIEESVLTHPLPHSLEKLMNQTPQEQWPVRWLVWAVIGKRSEHLATLLKAGLKDDGTALAQAVNRRNAEMMEMLYPFSDPHKALALKPMFAETLEQLIARKSKEGLQNAVGASTRAVPQRKI